MKSCPLGCTSDHNGNIVIVLLALAVVLEVVVMLAMVVPVSSIAAAATSANFHFTGVNAAMDRVGFEILV